ncbi:hypothetical protein CR513_20841, partial [Mucuna pruriens]
MSYQWWDSYTTTKSLQELKDDLISRFQLTLVLLGMKQDGSVMKYRKRLNIFLTTQNFKTELSLRNLVDMTMLIDKRNVVVKKESGRHKGNH